jgi:hypothetical protein
MSSKKRVFVVSTGNAGSSAIAGMLKYSGIDMLDTGQKGPYNPRGYIEDFRINELRDEELIRQVIQHHREKALWGCKWPFPTVLTAFECFEDNEELFVIHADRHIKEIQAHFAAENNSDDPNSHLLRVAQILSQIPNVFRVWFPTTITKPEHTLRSIYHFLGIQRTDEQIKKGVAFVDPTLYHFKA